MFLVDELREQLAKGGFELEVHFGRNWLTRNPEGSLERLARDRRPVSWVLFSTTAAIQRWFMVRGLPCVLAGSCHAGITLPTIDVDFYALGQHAARQLLSRGHRRIALLVPALGMAGELKLVSGVLSVTAGIREAAVRVVEHDGTPLVLRRRVEDLLQRTPPTGLLVAGAPYVVTVMTLLGRAGVRVPEDLSVISRDAEPYLDYIVPSLTRYAIDPARYAQRLSRSVVALTQGGSVPVRGQLLVPRFIAGETLGYLLPKNTGDR
jgi:LacI family transcriptional regulator